MDTSFQEMEFGIEIREVLDRPVAKGEVEIRLAHLEVLDDVVELQQVLFGQLYQFAFL